ncbi:hypothetical protein [Nocardia wallacei]|uniref:hypothetical protein n=1 Tax=Nocardia wallacei TaxID=480035 RepID=UPI002454EBE8|nr:hypothetical protein [Nocardia wallacei]
MNCDTLCYVPSTARPATSHRLRLSIGVAAAVVAVLVVAAIVVAVRSQPGTQRTFPCPGDSVSAAADWAPSSRSFTAGYEGHPFVGNGYLGLRVPPAGTGYVETGEITGYPMYTPRYDGAFAAGLYARDPAVAGGLEVAAALPNWSTLRVGVGDETFSSATPPARPRSPRHPPPPRGGGAARHRGGTGAGSTGAHPARAAAAAGRGRHRRRIRHGAGPRGLRPDRGRITRRGGRIGAVRDRAGNPGARPPRIPPSHRATRHLSARRIRLAAARASPGRGGAGPSRRGVAGARSSHRVLRRGR